MDMSVKAYGDLTKDELYGVLRLRSAVFVVEQLCPYQDIDGRDGDAYHLRLLDGEELIGYLRIIGEDDGTASIGRVISVRRRQGLATMMLEHALSFIEERFGGCTVRLEAQVYAKNLYSKLGFIETGGEFLLDGIPHIAMEKVLQK